jgi:hypothetical protein
MSYKRVTLQLCECCGSLLYADLLWLLHVPDCDCRMRPVFLQG